MHVILLYLLSFIHVLCSFHSRTNLSNDIHCFLRIVVQFSHILFFFSRFCYFSIPCYAVCSLSFWSFYSSFWINFIGFPLQIEITFFRNGRGREMKTGINFTVWNNQWKNTLLFRFYSFFFFFQFRHNGEATKNLWNSYHILCLVHPHLLEFCYNFIQNHSSKFNWIEVQWITKQLPIKAPT